MLALAVKAPAAVGTDESNEVGPEPATPPPRNKTPPSSFSGEQLEAVDASEGTKGILKRSLTDSSSVHSVVSEVQRLEEELQAAKIKLGCLRDSQPSIVRPLGNLFEMGWDTNCFVEIFSLFLPLFSSISRAEARKVQRAAVHCTRNTADNSQR